MQDSVIHRVEHHVGSGHRSAAGVRDLDGHLDRLRRQVICRPGRTVTASRLCGSATSARNSLAILRFLDLARAFVGAAHQGDGDKHVGHVARLQRHADGRRVPFQAGRE